MAKVSNEIFALSDTEDKNQLLFYRKDGDILKGDVNDFKEEVFRLYEAYISMKMMSGEEPDHVDFEIGLEMSDDSKCIQVTLRSVNRKTLKSFFKKIFG